jgi:general secretion pathway protein K
MPFPLLNSAKAIGLSEPPLDSTPLPRSSPSCAKDSGFALIIVLWTLILIAFIVAHLTAAGRTQIRIAGNLVANAVTQAAADGAIFEAIFNQSDPQPQQRWPVDGNAREVLVGNSRVLMRLEDEA